MQTLAAWIQALSPYGTFLFVCALVGGTFFLARLGFQLVGFGAPETDMDVDGAHGGHSDPDAGFRILSVHGLSAFFMMFGLVGLALHVQSGFGPALATLGGIAAGLLAVEGIRRMFRLFIGLQVSGTIQSEQFIGCKGEIYASVPAAGTGVATVSVRGRRREVDVRTESGQALESGAAIEVIAREGARFVVRPVR